MRAIRFRAWAWDMKYPAYEKKYQLLDVVSINFEEGEVTLPYRGHKSRVVPLADTPIMQFTGLLDKNGKEIYEGDIVEAPYLIEDGLCISDDKSGVWKGPVIYKNACFAVSDSSGYHPCLMNCCITSEWVVLGNIHENPELLGGGA